MFRLRKNSGFTLAELMVVIGIIAIISALAIPGLIGWLPKHKLGNIRQTPLIQLALSAKQQAFGLAKASTLPRYCLDCDVRFVCNGGCPKNRILTTPDGEPGLNYLCDGYKAFFTHIRQPMNEMAHAVRRGQEVNDGRTKPISVVRAPVAR